MSQNKTQMKFVYDADEPLGKLFASMRVDGFLSSLLQPSEYSFGKEGRKLTFSLFLDDEDLDVFKMAAHSKYVNHPELGQAYGVFAHQYGVKRWLAVN